MEKKGSLKKGIQYIMVAILPAVCSGCFPLFVPAGGERGGGKHGSHDDEGRHCGHCQEGLSWSSRCKAPPGISAIN